jgi:hypothetical protein
MTIEKFTQNNENEWPPTMYFKQVLQHCPTAALLYSEMWSQKDKNNRLTIPKKEVFPKFLLSVANLKLRLGMLCREGLVSIDEDKKVIKVEIVDWDYSEDEE